MPTPSTSVIYPSEPVTTPSTPPVDVTMLAMLGLTIAGTGLMKTQSAIAKQKEQDAKKANDLAVLQAQQDAQKADASANWAENQAMQAEAGQDVVVGMMQSQANKNYWVAFAIWKAQVALVEAKKRAQALARKKAEQTTVTKQIVITPQMKLLLGLGLFTVLLLSGGSIAQNKPYAKPIPISDTTPDLSQCVEPVPGSSGVMTLCPDGGGIGGMIIYISQRASKFIISIIRGYIFQIVASAVNIAIEAITPDAQDVVNTATDVLTDTLVESTTNDVDFYFRGTTEGYLGNPNTIALGITSTTTQPGVATVFATVAETMFGGDGVVYIFSANSLANIIPSGGNVLAGREFEVGFNILPAELEVLAMLKITDQEARSILATMGITIDSTIDLDYQNTALRDLTPLTKVKISQFVLLAGGMGGLP